MRQEANSYVFKVALRHRRSIWRQIAMDGDLTLHDLHEAIFHAFDRYDEHLYSFSFAKRSGRGWRNPEMAPEYNHPMAADEPGPFADDFRKDASQTLLDSLHLRKGQRFAYLFDFGDEWWHDVVVEAIHDGQRAASIGVIESRGKSPPQYPTSD
jgi:hypothetical protein